MKVKKNKGFTLAEMLIAVAIIGVLMAVSFIAVQNYLRSLHQFMDLAPHDVAVRVWTNPYRVDDVATPKGKRFRLVNLPFYYVAQLDKILDRLG